MNSKNVLSFSEKKISKNAVITFIMGIAELLGFLILMLISIFSRGKMGIAGGLAGCLLVLLAFFGVFWGVLSYDDIKTNQRFKISGICLNIVVIFLGITFVMI
ncbi:MAG: DUF6142 family protein [Eubacteriales bacterium]|nr:DUF6142 family protein [Eubacteriales bacterium]